MARSKAITTAMGQVAATIPLELQLRRAVLSCMLWEDSFYESGESIATRIHFLIDHVSDKIVADMAIEARTQQKLRHVPLWLAKGLAHNRSPLTAKVLEAIIQRPDELVEFLNQYWFGKKTPLSAQVKKGLAKAFTKFDEYQLAKWNRDGAIKLRDVMFLVHPKPKDDVQAAVWKRLADKQLQTPDTWEVELSASKDKKASWERLLKEKKLGAMALMRNLRNMVDANVDNALVKKALAESNPEKILPFRYVPAAKAAPAYAKDLEKMMLRQLINAEKLPGKTILVVDTSGSMFGGNVSRKSDISRLEAAGALAALIKETCEESVLYATAGNDGTRVHATMKMPDIKGFELIEYIRDHKMDRTIGGGGIFLVQCLAYIKKLENTADRIIVITDEQDCDSNDKSPDKADAFGTRNYLINISVERNGIGYGQQWTHIDGWSEQVVSYIAECEK